ncbi:MAG: hypothetical protein JW726_19555 [Anaerolineales bacterium]|nr:hypothetical protein [Anaerolineales bacterium]
MGQTQPVKAVFAVYKDAMEAQALALMGRKMRAAQTLYGDEVGGAIVPVEEGDFITELAREVLRGAELDDLQSLFADEMRVCKLDEVQRHSPMGCPTEISPVLIPVKPKTWQEWVLEHQAAKAAAGRRSAGKRSNIVQPGQLSIWSNPKEE